MELDLQPGDVVKVLESAALGWVRARVIRVKSGGRVVVQSDQGREFTARGNQVRLIPVDDVLFFQSDLKYTRVVTARGESLIRRALKDLEAELDAEQFWQIHRSTIVNSRAIAHLERTDDRLVVVVRDCAERLEVSRTYAQRFRGM